MSDMSGDLTQMRELIARLPESDRERIDAIAKALRNLIATCGAPGMLALHLVNAEIKAQTS